MGRPRQPEHDDRRRARASRSTACTTARPTTTRASRRGHFENEGIDAKITRMQYVERAVHSAQLDGEHQYGGAPLRLGGHGERRASRRARSLGVRAGRSRPAPTAPTSSLAEHRQRRRRAHVLRARRAQRRRQGRLPARASARSGREHLLKIGGLGRRTTRDADIAPTRSARREPADSVTLARAGADLRRAVHCGPATASSRSRRWRRVDRTTRATSSRPAT